MAENKLYTSRLGAGLGLINETKTLLDLWSPGVSAGELYQFALESGRFPTITARRLRNIIVECFAPRYLIAGGAPAAHLKRLSATFSTSDLTQLMLVFTSRANPILGEFIRHVYWPRYVGGYTQITNEDACTFVERAIDDGKTVRRWSDSMVRNVSGYLTGCCADYGLLERGQKTSRKIIPFRISSSPAAYLAYEQHFAGVGDNALLIHEDWQLFGLAREDVLEEIKRLSLKGLLIVQAAGDVTRISWKQQDMEALCDVLTES
ncbi:BrxA family protein [Nitrosospira sp. Nsp1]|uniref:BrxA family protein n=1 Tax=Nitrosospira sp. Nsp1 TaxID=136547 RepID=UPI0008819AFF|nr:BrxA family protein [Nitrosospira sp. Nsp1]SCX49952.1 Putative inner membrane protein [Nitrosospira sp. Nsp1]